MADQSSSGDGRRLKDARHDRLKLALRENLRRRKVQARERGQIDGNVTEPSSADHETSLHGEVGKRSD